MEVYLLKDKKVTELIDGEDPKLHTKDFYDNEEEHHLILLSIDEFNERKNIFQFPERVYEELNDDKQYPNAEFYDDLIFLTLNEISYTTVKKEKLKASELNLILGKSNFMIVYHEKNEFVLNLIKKIDKSNIFRAMYTFIDGILDNDKRIIHEIEKSALLIEDKILKSTVLTSDALRGLSKKEKEKYVSERKTKVSPEVYMRDIVNLRKQLQFIKRYFEPTSDVIEMLEADESELIPEFYDKYFLKLSLKADRNSNSLINLREYIAQVREAWQSQVDLDLNNRMNFLTIVSVIFMPLTLIAGWYGMNFKYMPELNWKYGYVFVAVISILVLTFSIYWLRKNKYM